MGGRSGVGRPGRATSPGAGVADGATGLAVLPGSWIDFRVGIGIGEDSKIAAAGAPDSEGGGGVAPLCSEEETPTRPVVGLGAGSGPHPAAPSNSRKLRQKKIGMVSPRNSPVTIDPHPLA